MGKLVLLETARISTRLWYVYFTDSYGAIDATGKSKREAITLLPTPTPNFVQQIARNKDEAIELVKQQQAEALLASPL